MGLTGKTEPGMTSTIARLNDMRKSLRKNGMTLMEVTVVVGIIAVLVGFGAPAVRALLDSFQNEAATRMMVNAALDSARSLASVHGDVGVRFQKAYNRTNPSNVLDADQYMVLVKLDNEGDRPKKGFSVLEGHKPVRLPDRFGVMDLYAGSGSGTEVDRNTAFDSEAIRDLTTFTVVFSRTGKLDRRDVQVISLHDDDRTFNTRKKLDACTTCPPPVFLIDDVIAGGSEDVEISRDQLVIYDRQKFRRALQEGQPYEDCLKSLPRVFVAPYAGRLMQ